MLKNLADANRDLQSATQTYNQLVRTEGQKDFTNDLARSLNNRAWLYATCPDPEFRNGKQALDCATYAWRLGAWNSFIALDTLAAAHAENGNFTEAVKWQTKAVRVAPDGAKPELQSRLQLYEMQKPYREK